MKTKHFLVLGILVISMAGCDFFDTKSVSTMDSKDVFSTPAYTEQAIAGVYELFGENNSYRNRIACGYQGLNTDIEHSTKSDDAKKPDEANLMLYNVSYDNGQVSSTTKSDIWSYLNTGVERCNEIIEGIEANSNYANPVNDVDNAMRYYLGEAYFLRGFIVLEMLKFWGDIPARYESLTVNPDGVNAQKEDRNVSFEQVRSDLKKAQEYMPYSVEIPVGMAKNNVGRGSKGAALALLARADLMYAGKAVRPTELKKGGVASYKIDYDVDAAKREELYKEALEACAEVIKNDGKVLAPDFATPFQQICSDVKDYSAMEHLWAIPFANGARGQVLNYNSPKLPSQSTDATKPTCLAGILRGYGKNGSSSGHITVSPYLFYKYSKNDKRRDVTAVPFQWYYDNGSSVINDSTREIAFHGLDTVTFRLYQKNTQINNFYLGKYRFEWMAEGRSLTGTDDGVDFPVLRYADVLLMFAEAAIGGISGDKPVNNTGLKELEIFNQIRERAGIAAASSLDMDTIKLERAKELCGEYVRKYDLMRWGCLKQDVMKAETFIRSIARAEGRAAENISDTLYFKYAYDKILNAYVMDSIYGLSVNEVGAPPTYSKATGWVKKGLFESSTKGNLLDPDQYHIYSTEENLEARQYWPIFMYYVSASNGNLWNDYGYPN